MIVRCGTPFGNQGPAACRDFGRILRSCGNPLPEAVPQRYSPPLLKRRRISIFEPELFVQFAGPGGFFGCSSSTGARQRDRL